MSAQTSGRIAEVFYDVDDYVEPGAPIVRFTNVEQQSALRQADAALAEARAYNLTGAENHLTRLLELKPGDEESLRFIEMVRKYKVSAADMRLEIFIRSMNER
mgnify:CR=1 FL=1